MPIKPNVRYFRAVVGGEGEAGHVSERLVLNPEMRDHRHLRRQQLPPDRIGEIGIRQALRTQLGPRFQPRISGGRCGSEGVSRGQ